MFMDIVIFSYLLHLMNRNHDNHLHTRVTIHTNAVNYVCIVIQNKMRF